MASDNPLGPCINEIDEFVERMFDRMDTDLTGYLQESGSDHEEVANKIICLLLDKLDELEKRRQHPGREEG